MMVYVIVNVQNALEENFMQQSAFAMIVIRMLVECTHENNARF